MSSNNSHTSKAFHLSEQGIILRDISNTANTLSNFKSKILLEFLVPFNTPEKQKVLKVLMSRDQRVKFVPTGNSSTLVKLMTPAGDQGKNISFRIEMEALLPHNGQIKRIPLDDPVSASILLIPTI